MSPIIKFGDNDNPNITVLLRIITHQMSVGGAFLGLPYYDYPRPEGIEGVIFDSFDVVLSGDAPKRVEELDIEYLKSCFREIKLSFDRFPLEGYFPEKWVLRQRLERLKAVINNNGIVEVPIYGEYWHEPKPKVVLYWGNIKKDKKPELALDATLVHELFHAWNYFCSDRKPRSIPEIDEALVEYATLSFLEKLSQSDLVDGGIWKSHFQSVFKWQMNSVKDMQFCVGLQPAYGFGAYIFENDTQKELLGVYPALSGELSANDPDVKKAVSLLNPIYPFDNEALTLKYIIDALNNKLPGKNKINPAIYSIHNNNCTNMYRNHWTQFVRMWLANSPKATTNMINTQNPRTNSSDYLPEPWWGNDGNDPLDSVCVNLNPGKGDIIQLRSSVSGLPMYNPAALASHLPLTDAWHRDKRALPIAKALRACGCSASGTNSGNLDIELVPWHSEHATPAYGFDVYVKTAAPDIFKWGLSFASDESRRICNPVLKNTVLMRFSASNADRLFNAFYQSHTIQHPVQKSPVYLLPNQNTCWCIYTLSEFPDIRFVCIWRKKGFGLNNFPSEADMIAIFQELSIRRSYPCI